MLVRTGKLHKRTAVNIHRWQKARPRLSIWSAWVESGAAGNNVLEQLRRQRVKKRRSPAAGAAPRDPVDAHSSSVLAFGGHGGGGTGT